MPDLLQQLLFESHIKADCKLYAEDADPKRDYITQKRESDYQFFCRLAAEEGISFWFEDAGIEPRMFYSDSHLGMTADIDLIYNPQYETDTKDHTAYHWRYRESLLSDKILYKDYNSKRSSYPLESKIEGEIHNQHPFYESYGRFQTQDDADRYTKIRMEEIQQQRCVGNALTNCFALMPGKIFSLSSHPCSNMNRRWQVIAITHHGTQPLADNREGQGTTLSNNLTFIPDNLNWRPPFIHKPTADGDELATVVGPEGEEICTNEEGAVQVYFHWDRMREPELGSSCWVRVAQGWNGNHEVMMRGTFANIRIRNEMVPGIEGGFTKHIPTGETLAIYDAAMRYQQEQTPLAIIAGNEYGSGSSRDWTAKGTRLLGVRVVIAGSFERIHRSNLIGMGVLPLEFPKGVSRQTLGLKGDEKIEITGLNSLTPGQDVAVNITFADGRRETIMARCRIDTQTELAYFEHGGILHYIIRNML